MRSQSEAAVSASHFPDRWSKNLIGTEQIPTTSGFNLGVAEYHATDFSQVQVHDDQEALYVVSGVGEIELDGEVLVLQPGTAVYGPACRIRRVAPRTRR